MSVLQLVFGNPNKPKKKAKKRNTKKGVSVARSKKKAVKKKATTKKRVVKKKVAKKKVAKKKVAKKKVAKKKVTKRKVAKKPTKRKVTKKKVAKKKVVKKKAKKKVVKRKPAKKARKKTTRRKSAGSSFNTFAAGMYTNMAAIGKKKAKKKAKKKVTKRKSTKKKATKRKTAPKKARAKTKAKGPRKNRAWRISEVSKLKKGQAKRFAYKAYGSKKNKHQKKSKRLAGKGSKYNVNQKWYRTNPIGGAMKNVEKYLKHNIGEASGLALGGFISEGLNAQVLNKFPALGGQLGKVFGRFTGSAIPMIAGIVTGVVSDKVKNKAVKKNAEMIAKGLIGSSVVGIGNIAYNVLLGQASAPVSGFNIGPSQNYRFESQQDTDFAGFVQGGNSMDGFITGDDAMGYDDADFGEYDDADFGEYTDEDSY